jgi:chromosome segregation ATPase
MGVIDNLSKEVKEYTTIYSDVLVGVHNDMKSTKKEMSSLKTETNSAIKNLNIVSYQANKMISLNKETIEEIHEFNIKIEAQKGDLENFVNSNKEDIISQQQKIKNFIENNEDYIQKSLNTMSDLEKKVTDEYYLLLDKTNNLNVEVAMLDKHLKELNTQNIECSNKLNILEKESEKRNRATTINIIVLYTILTIITLAISYQYFY